MSKAILQLDALSCPSCMQKIKGALEKQDGVEKRQSVVQCSQGQDRFRWGQNLCRQAVGYGN